MAEQRHRAKLILAVLAMGSLAACIPSNGGGPYAPPRSDAPEPLPHGQWSDDRVQALPAPRPAWQTRTVTPDARRVTASTYTVVRGDNLRIIAEKTGAGSEAIARANNLSPPFTIFAGQRLAIPAGRYHLVRAGETGIAIARAYGIDWSRVVTANQLAEPYILRVGQRVLIPEGGVTTGGVPLSRAERAQAFRVDIDDLLTGSEPAIAENASPVRPVANASRVLPATAAVGEPARLSGRFQWPVSGAVVKRFGRGASGERNDGIKIAVPVDTPILAAADGVVAYVGSDIQALGGLVILKHGDGWTTVYGHAGQLLVQRGQAVKKGQTIALSGNSGFADRPELHFEMRQGRTPVDPVGRLPAR